MSDDFRPNVAGELAYVVPHVLADAMSDDFRPNVAGESMTDTRFSAKMPFDLRANAIYAAGKLGRGAKFR
jgi:hypothetical protein